jgi:Asp-tRNA(Asn)/Glu-tRNA(Gln) amidotransferase A subunit family amidase
MSAELTRKELLTTALCATVLAALPARSSGQTANTPDLTVADLRAFQKVAGLSFTDEELTAALPEVKSNLSALLSLHRPFDNRLEPPTIFTPIRAASKPSKPKLKLDRVSLKRPANDEDLAFLSVHELGHLLRTRQVTSVELTKIYLARIAKYNPKLMCVVTVLDQYGLEQAAKADRELALGKVRGPLHGIPFGVKDLLSKKGFPTTWGAEPFVTQSLDYDATVVRRLESAGAVLIAKLTTGSLAYNDQWFGGQTKNPWNLSRGSSGSSAGPGSATAAALVAFAIGTETLGSIVSPSNECRVTGLRPSYGRVSRYGAMDLSYTMDKLGPMCRSTQDCALVFSAIYGKDPFDRSSVDGGFIFEPNLDLSKLRVGVVSEGAVPGDDPVLGILAKAGAQLKKAKLPGDPEKLLPILDCEGACAFEELTRNGGINELKAKFWQNTFRGARFVSAVDYLLAQRARAELMADVDHFFKDFDLLFDVGIGNNSILHTNLTGHPQILIPLGPTKSNTSQSRSLVGQMDAEGLLLSVSWAIQRQLPYWRLRPDMSKVA